MTKEDIIRLAKEAGFSDHSSPEMWGVMVASHEEIERFAALVAAAVLAEPEPITEDALREQLDTQDRDLWQRRADEEFLKEYEKRYRKLERKPHITCGFVDVQFDGRGWFCAKCSKRMPANYEALVKRDSGERHYLELMRRKAEAIRARGQ
jgi:hypothetical protein